MLIHGVIYCFFFCMLHSLQSMSVVPYQQKLKASAIESLPQDLLKEVISYCSNKDIEKNIMQVNKYFLNYLDNQGLLNDHYAKVAGIIFPIVLFNNEYYLLNHVGEEYSNELYDENNEEKFYIDTFIWPSFGCNVKESSEEEKTVVSCLARGGADHKTRYNFKSLDPFGELQPLIKYHIDCNFVSVKKSFVTIKDIRDLAVSIKCGYGSEVKKKYSQLEAAVAKSNRSDHKDLILQRLIQLKPILILTSSIHHEQSRIRSFCNFLYYFFVERLTYRTVIKNFAYCLKSRSFYVKSVDGLFESVLWEYTKNIVLDCMGYGLWKSFVWLLPNMYYKVESKCKRKNMASS